MVGLGCGLGLGLGLTILCSAAPVQEKQLILGETLIDSAKLQATIQESALRAGAEKLWDAAQASVEEEGHATRAIGTAGHNATLDYIWDQLYELEDYYDLQAQTFVALSGRIDSYSVNDTKGEVNVRPLQMTPSTDGIIEAEVVDVRGEGCLNSDFYGIEGKIALVKRGGCTFGEKSEAAGQFGAKAVLIWDPNAGDDDDLVSADLGTPLGHQVATLAVTRKWALTRPEGAVRIDVDATVEEIPTVNILAETRGGNHDNVVFAGAHTDSVRAGPGINDNGSGTVTLLEVAKQLANFEVVNAVRFAWWSAEELGLKGSLYYTENILPREAQKIRMFLDYDMMASPNYVYEIYDSEDANGENPAGSAALRDLYKDWYNSQGLPWVLQPFDGRSDYAGFLEIGVPSSGIDAGAEVLKTPEEARTFGGDAEVPYDKCYHEACDNLDNPNYDAWMVNSRLVAHSVATYARSMEGFPQRSDEYKSQGVTEVRRKFVLM